jgi:LmbE family N-acetylglucosaminyl deacetylase
MKSCRILYVYPHPDDESFGPAAVIYDQVRDGHEVYLLTLTKGGATKQRFKLGVSVEEMGEIRFKEMINVKEVLKLSGMKVLDLPDSGLQEMDPRKIEKIVTEHIQKIKPDILVSYPVHGISGFHDHLVMHAVIKRVFLEMKESKNDYPKRLAFNTLIDKGLSPWVGDLIIMKQSPRELVDCIVKIDNEMKQAMKDSLSCYETYKDTIEKSGVVEKIGDEIPFEFFNEDFNPPLNKLTDNLSE